MLSGDWFGVLPCFVFVKFCTCTCKFFLIPHTCFYYFICDWWSDSIIYVTAETKNLEAKSGSGCSRSNCRRHLQTMWLSIFIFPVLYVSLLCLPPSPHSEFRTSIFHGLKGPITGIPFSWTIRVFMYL